MQKISGILGASARVTSVDMKDAPPVRPGMPGFGRPEGVSSLRQRAVAAPPTPDALSAAPQLFQDQMGIRSKEAQQAKMAAEVSNSFFMKKREQVEQAPAANEQMVDVVLAMPAQVPASQIDAIASKPAQADYDEVAAVAKEAFEPDALYPKGSFVDVVA